ncbi:MAG: carboxypeptidase regulatory-like domain-containing protein, partial [Acidobacteria bacterium]|nr:carboxypeptidase regulatory-like domain-containing protein [Acidobacteriota bacterium]
MIASRGAVALLWIALSAASPAAAQVASGDLSGRVSDATGGALVGVSVTVRDPSTGLERVATSGPDGRFLVVGLPDTGAYDVRTEQAGFAAAFRQGVRVAAGRTSTVDFVLAVAAGATVVVRPLDVILDRQESAGRQSVGEPLLRTLPLFSRDVLQMASLAAGFTGNPDFPSPQGQTYWAHNVLVDGASHFSKWRGAPRAFASGYPLESIAGVDVLTSRFPAAYGDALASVTSVVTKAGTNTWAGSALLYLHDEALDARPLFAAVTPPASSQQLGASVGGPLVPSRVHLFASYERQRSRNQNVVVSPAAPQALVPDDRDEHLAFVRVDHRRSATHTMTARYNGQILDWRRQPGGLVLPGSGTRYRNESHTALGTDATVIGGATANELRLQAARYVDLRTDLSPVVA